ncbi:MAG TPA: hypothetical protein VH353_09945 [Caulobacteraceae bacterium]|jgi:hypothetical protein|nr:hypothetical protein [Caulobacteraceae bacterium]
MTLAAVPLAILILAGCAMTGVGSGSSPNGTVKATFTWKAEGPPPHAAANQSLKEGELS